MSEASSLVRWAWQDPPGRVQQAIERVNELARTATGSQLSEVQDAGQMLSRLADAIEPALVAAAVPGTDLLSIQLSAGSIVSQVLDLAGGRKDAWRNERRGPHGEWVGSGGVGAGDRALMQRAARNNRLAADRKARLDAARQALAEQQARAPASATGAEPVSTSNKAADIAAAAKALAAMPLLPGESREAHMNPLGGESAQMNLLHEQIIHQHVTPILEARAALVLDAAKAHVAEKIKEVEQASDTEEGHKAKLKAATEASIAIAGGIIAYIGAKVGLPDLLAVASAVGPILIQVLIELWKKL